MTLWHPLALDHFNDDWASVTGHPDTGGSKAQVEGTSSSSERVFPQRQNKSLVADKRSQPVEHLQNYTDAAAPHSEHLSPRQFSSLPLALRQPSQSEIFEPKGEYTGEEHIEPNLKCGEMPAC